MACGSSCSCIKCSSSGLKRAFAQEPALIEYLSLATAKARGKPGANVRTMWKMTTQAIYSNRDLPLLAVREALQNSLDAIKAARRAKQHAEGIFRVELDETNRSISFEDDGIGMDEDTILNKFLMLGESGKYDDKEAVGGFGVAKAVILGTSMTFRWEMFTRDNHVVADGKSEDVLIYPAPLRVGTRLTIFDIDPKFMTFYDYLEDMSLSLYERIRLFLEANEVPITLMLNDKIIEARFGSQRGSKLNLSNSTQERNFSASVRTYPMREGSPTRVYVRLNGLVQFGYQITSNRDAVIELTTKLRPGEQGYPFNAARDAFMTTAFNFKRMVDYALEAIVKPRPPSLIFHKLGFFRPKVDKIVTSLLATLPQDLQTWIYKLEGAAAITLEPPPTLDELARPDLLAARRQKEHPFGHLGVVYVSRDHFSEQRLNTLWKQAETWIPHMLLWRICLQAIIYEANLNLEFQSGFILDDQLIGMCILDHDTRVNRIVLNPYRLEEFRRKHEAEPLQVAAWIHAVAVHELTHADGLMGHGHDDVYAIQREALGAKTFGLLPRLSQITLHVLKLSPPADDPTVELQRLRTELEACNKRSPSATKKSNAIRAQIADEQNRLRSLTGPVRAAIEREQESAGPVMHDPLGNQVSTAFSAWLASIQDEELSNFVRRHALKLTHFLRQMLFDKRVREAQKQWPTTLPDKHPAIRLYAALPFLTYSTFEVPLDPLSRAELATSLHHLFGLSDGKQLILDKLQDAVLGGEVVTLLNAQS